MQNWGSIVVCLGLVFIFGCSDDSDPTADIQSDAGTDTMAIEPHSFAEYVQLAESLCVGGDELVFGRRLLPYHPSGLQWLWRENGIVYLLVDADCRVFFPDIGRTDRYSMWPPPLTKKISTQEFARVLQRMRALEWAEKLEENTFYSLELIDDIVEFYLGGKLYALSASYDEISDVHQQGLLGDYDLTPRDLLLEDMDQYWPWDDPIITSSVEPYIGESLKLTIEIDPRSPDGIWKPKLGVPMVVHDWPLARPPQEFNMFSEQNQDPDVQEARCRGGINFLTGEEADAFRRLRDDMLTHGPYSNMTSWLLMQHEGLEMMILFREVLPFEGENGLSFYDFPNAGCD